MRVRTKYLPKRTKLEMEKLKGTIFELMLTKSEMVAVAQRMAILELLSEGANYDDIKKATKVSSATIALVKRRALDSQVSH